MTYWCMYNIQICVKGVKLICGTVDLVLVVHFNINEVTKVLNKL